MSYLKRFWYNIKNSFYNPEFYELVKEKRLSRGVWLLSGIFFIQMLVIAIIAVGAFFIFVAKFPSQELISDYYPEGVELTAKDNMFSSNVEEPFVIPVPENFAGEPKEEFENILVIDTSEGLTLDDIRSYDSYAVITREGVAVRGSSGKIEALSLADAKIGDFTVTEQKVSEWADIAINFAKAAIVPLAIVMIILGTTLLTLWQMFALVFGALIVKLIAYIKKTPLEYAKAYMVALYASVPVIIFNLLLTMIWPIPFLLDLVLFVVVVAVNLKGSVTKDTPASAEPVAPAAQV